MKETITMLVVEIIGVIFLGFLIFNLYKLLRAGNIEKNILIKNKTLIIIIIVFSIVLGVRFLSGEDSWICKEGQWVKHGNPSAKAPTEGCGKPSLVGGDRDVHNCIGSAGYSWCEMKQKCLRPWEEPCSVQNASTSLPQGYSLEKYEIKETLNISCQKYTDCETPGKYLVQSNCPYTSLCLKNKCTVVCPHYNGKQN